MAIARRCLDCGILTSRSRCGPCLRAKEAYRNAARAGRYDGEYQRIAAQVRASVVPGVTVCWRCERPILAMDAVDCDHAPHGLVPTHAACNRGKRLPV